MAHHPTLIDLVRVIPVAQTQIRGKIAITLTSVDCYADGWVVNLRVHSDPRFYPVFNFFPRPVDGSVPRFGGGERHWHHREGDPNWYFAISFYPALAPTDGDIGFVANVIHLVDTPDRNWIMLVEDVPGPWRFVVPPATGVSAEEAEAVGDPVRLVNIAMRDGRRARTLPLYGPFFDDLLDLLYRYTPFNLAWETGGPEENVGVAELTIKRLPTAVSANDVLDILVSAFHDDRGYMPRATKGFEPLAEAIWSTWQQQTGNESMQ